MAPRKQNSKFKTFISFLKNNYFLLIFVGCIGFVGVVAFYKLFIAKPTYVYAKVKVGQGLWWATTQRPSFWYVQAIQNANEQLDLTGKPLAKILLVEYYPYWGSNQFDVYVTLKLKVSKVGKKSTYNFNRETIGVSSPIDLEFPTVQFSGAIIALSEKPFNETYEYKTVHLYRKSIYPWEYDQIQVGDTLMNGKKLLVKILAKERGETNDVLLSDFGKLVNSDIEPYRYSRVTVLVRVKKVDGKYIFGEEYVVSPGRGIPVVTNNIVLNDFTITHVDEQ